MTIEEIYSKIDPIPCGDMLNLDNAKNIAELLGDIKGNVIEIGTFCGRSAAMFQLLTGRYVWTLDKENRLDIARKHWAELGIDKFIIPYVGDSTEIADTWWEMEADIVYIDGGHTYEQCMKDIQRWTPHARKIIIGHDYNDDFRGVKRAVDDFFGDLVIEKGNIWAVKKSK